MDKNINSMDNTKLATSVAALLKLEPLVGLDPNDQSGLLELVSQAQDVALKYELENTDPEILKNLALAVNQWGVEFSDTEWAARILSDNSQESPDRVDELFLYFTCENIGIDAIDFSAYSILKFRRKYPELEYAGKDIHIASQMALEIAKAHNINDLLNTYSCLEIILFTCVDFSRDPVCQPLKTIFENNQLGSDQKISESFAWLNENLARITEEIKCRNGV